MPKMSVTVTHWLASAHNRAGKSDVGPEHLLAGLLADPHTIAAQRLQTSGATLSTDIAAQDFESRSAPRFNTESTFVMETTVQKQFQESGIDLITLNQQLTEAV
jgi:Clp amino terminal domain, pathogenicity island component